MSKLKAEKLVKRFSGQSAVNGVSLELSDHSIVGLLGPNGAGKTSLLNCITGYYHPQEGEIFFNGKEITRLSTHHLTSIGIGRTYQNIELFPGMTVLSNMLLARHVHCKYSLGWASLFSKSVRDEEFRHRKILEELIDFLEMQSLRKQLVGSLSYGMRKRVELGRALALEPKLLVLDEPFAGMTLEEKEDMVRFLMELNKAWNQTMILVEHDMSVVMSISDKIMVLDFGVKLAEGSPDFVQNHPQVIKAYLGDTSTID